MSLCEDLLLWQAEGGSFELRGEISGRSVGSFRDAAEAIQVGVDRIAADGAGRLRIARGRYLLARPVRLRSHVKLAGSGPGSRLVVADANEEGLGVISEGIDRPVVCDLLLRPETEGAATAGLVLEKCGQPRVRGVESAGFGGYGFWARKENYMLVLEGCTAGGNAKAGFYLDHHQIGPRGNFPPILLTTCAAFGGGTGFDIRRSTVVNVVGCIAYQCRGVGYFVHSGSCSVLLNGCRTFQLGRQAVLAEEAHELNVTGNVFCWHAGDGIVVRNSGWGAITGNEVIDSGSVNPGGPDGTYKAADLPAGTPVGSAIRLENTQGFNVVGNTLFNWPQGRRMDHGVIEDGDSRDNRISNNLINYLSGEGIVSPRGRSCCTDNLIEKDRPFSGDPACDWIQTFRPELTDGFISGPVMNPGVAPMPEP